jgi:uncharacterized protein YceH (UPF0502 family)
LLLLVPADGPRDMAAFLAAARARRDPWTVATVGVGSTQHFVAEALQAEGDFRLTHVPYRGTPAAITALRAGEVQAVVDGLMKRQLVLEKSGFGSRVPKFQHLFCNTQFGSLKFSPRGTAIVCELLLRGPQTPGELRTHASRLAPIHDVSEVETELEELMTRPDGPFVAKLTREPGRRESRYMHLFSGEAPPFVEDEARPPRSAPGSPAGVSVAEERIAAVEAAVAELRHEIELLKSRVDAATGA